jgi:hypothetical protein
MNEWGIAGCRKNIAHIVRWLLTEARRRQWHIDKRPILSIAARLGTRTEWGMAFARMWARKLVEEAISNAERLQEASK